MPTRPKYRMATPGCAFWFCAALVVFIIGMFAALKFGIEYLREINSGGMKRLEVPCAEWPPLEEAKRTLAENAEIVERIEALAPSGTVKLKINNWQCSNGASLDIWIPGVRQRDAIYEMLGSDTWFFGVPYQLINW